MARIRPTVSQGTHATGFAQKFVIIENIDTAKHVATVKDKLGYRHTVRTDVLSAKGDGPAVGETWIIDRTGGTWTLRAVVGYTHVTAATVVAALPTADATTRGQIVIVLGATGVADGVFVCVKHADDTFSWVSIAP